MLKKVLRLLLAFTVVSQIASPVRTVSASEESDPINVVVDDFINQPEDEQVPDFDVEEDEDIIDEIEGDVSDEEVQISEVEDKPEDTNEHVETLTEVELNEGLVRINDIFPDSGLALMIAEELGLTIESYILLSDLESITGFFINTVEDTPGVVIESIEGLQYLTNLQAVAFVGHEIVDISPLANLTNLYRIELWENRISDISPLANLTNLERLYLNRNQITDLRPLGNLNLRQFSAMDQMVSLPQTTVGEGTQIEFFSRDGSRIENLLPRQWGGFFDYTDGILTWWSGGSNATHFWTTNFSATIYQEAVELESTCPINDDSERDSSFQASIDAMYDFLENNSAENPLIIPSVMGMPPSYALDKLGWGENVDLWTGLSGSESPGYVYWGSIALVLNSQIYEGGRHTCEDIYWFSNVELFIQYEGSQTDRPLLPQTGTAFMNTAVIGGAVLTVSGVSVYLKRKSKFMI